MTKIIGLTGGIGSGKSTVARYLESKGISIYIADDEARKLTDTTDVISAIEKVFGADVIENGLVNRKLLSQIVFNNAKNLEKLNSIIHPVVRNHFVEWLKKHSDEAFIIKEAAILFESGSYKDCDKIITVEVPEEIRIQRVIKRDASSEDDVRARMRNQWTDKMRAEKSDFVVVNIDRDAMKLQVDQILKNLKKLQ